MEVITMGNMVQIFYLYLSLAKLPPGNAPTTPPLFRIFIHRYFTHCHYLTMYDRLNTYYYTGSANIRFFFTRQALFMNIQARFYKRVSEK